MTGRAPLLLIGVALAATVCFLAVYLIFRSAR